MWFHRGVVSFARLFIFIRPTILCVFGVFCARVFCFFSQLFFRIIGTDCYLFFFSFSISTQQWYEHWTFTMYIHRFQTRRYSLGFDVMCVFSISFCSNLFLLLLFFICELLCWVSLESFIIRSLRTYALHMPFWAFNCKLLNHYIKWEYEGKTQRFG